MKAKPRWREDLKRWEIRPTIAGKRESIYGLSEQEAIDKAKAMLEDAEIVSLASPSYKAEPKLREFVMRSYLPTIANRSAAHQNNVAWAIGRILGFKDGGRDFGDLYLSEIKRAHIQRMLDAQPEKSRVDIKAKLHAILEFASAGEELIPSNPVTKYISVPNVHRKPKEIFTVEELALLIVASEGMVCRNAILLGCLGVCRGECLGLKWPLKDTITIYEQAKEGSRLKTENRYRTVPLPDGFVELLDGPRYGYVVKCRDLGNITGMKANKTKGVRARGFHRAVELAGIKPGRTFHDLRHTASTMLTQRGCNPFMKDAILGHTKQSMSAYYTSYPDLMDGMRHYLNLVFADIRSAIEGVMLDKVG